MKAFLKVLIALVHMCSLKLVNTTVPLPSRVQQHRAVIVEELQRALLLPPCDAEGGWAPALIYQATC